MINRRKDIIASIAPVYILFVPKVGYFTFFSLIGPRWVIFNTNLVFSICFICSTPNIYFNILFFSLVRTEVIDHVQSHFEKLDQVEVRELCKIVDEPSVDITNYRPTVVVFKKAGISDKIIDVLPRLEIFHNSFVFNKLWDLECGKFRENVMSLEEVVEQICEPVFVR